MKCYWINATERTVTEVEHNGIDDLRRRFDINIDSHKHYLESGDAFYQSWKDPEDWSTWITVNGIDYSHPGNAVVVGNEVGDGIADPAISLAELRRNVRFLSEWEKTKETVGQILDDMDPQNDKGIAHLWSILELPSDRTIRDLQKILREALQEVEERFGKLGPQGIWGTRLAMAVDAAGLCRGVGQHDLADKIQDVGANGPMAGTEIQ